MISVLVYVHTSMTSFSSCHLRRTMDEGGVKGTMRRNRKGGSEAWGAVVIDKVRGQIIKSVRLLDTSSNLKELINTASQACGSANQLSNQCLAMLTPSLE